MTRSGVRRFLWIVVVVGIASRVAFACFGGRVHVDGPFQYFEPAWQRLFGHGLEAWEWQEGVRPWVLPAYHGGWMALLTLLGLDGPWVYLALRLHWALAGVILFWAAWFCGEAIDRRCVRPNTGPAERGHVGALFSLTAVALFGPVVAMAPQPLSETPAAMAALASFALAELAADRWGRRGVGLAVCAGVAVGAAVCLRISQAPIVVGPGLVLLARRRSALLIPLAAGCVGIMLGFGLVDRLTWGGWFSSYVGYLDFNLIQGRAADYGTEPPFWYLEELATRMPVALFVMIVPAVAVWRVTWPYLATAFMLVAALSTQAHKEPRFITGVFPILLVASGAGFAVLLRDWWDRAFGPTMALAATFAAVLFVDGWRAGFPPPDPVEPALDAAAWLARHAGGAGRLEGVLQDSPFVTNGYGSMPQGTLLLPFEQALLTNPIVQHVLADAGSERERLALAAGFRRIYERGGRVVLSRIRGRQ